MYYHDSVRDDENARLPARFAAALERVAPGELLSRRRSALGLESPESAQLFWGKAAWSTFRALERSGGIAGPVLGIAPSLETPSISAQWLLGDHPLPGERSFAAGARLLEFFDGL